MRKFHNWNQVHNFLLSIGFIQVITHDQNIYYIRTNIKGEPERVHLIKDNKVDRLVVEELLGRLGIAYEEFMSIYREAYLRNRR
jgi:hypothetical protein